MICTSFQTLVVATCCVLCHDAALFEAEAPVHRVQAQDLGLVVLVVLLGDCYLPQSACEQMVLEQCSGWKWNWASQSGRVVHLPLPVGAVVGDRARPLHAVSPSRSCFFIFVIDDP